LAKQKQEKIMLALMKGFQIGGRSWKDLPLRIQGIVSEKEFLEESRKEQLRAERNAHPITLVLFGFKDSGFEESVDRRFLEILATMIVGCTRISEPKGWYRDGDHLRIGLLLPYTSPEEAEQPVSRIKERFQALADTKLRHLRASHTLVAEVKAFPADPKGGGDGSEDRRKRFERPVSTSRLPAAPVRDRLPSWKRTVDMVASGIALLVALPFCCLVAAWIKMVSPGALFFRQQRTGFMGEPFKMFKFRTMKPNSDESQHRQYLAQLIAAGDAKSGDGSKKAMTKMENDNRIIPGGKFIRATCLDEIPQLLNVLRGDMSLVGPRPPIPYEAEQYEAWHNHRFDAVPGMTGLWQVSGKNKLSFNEMVRLDIKYARELSPAMDWKILLKTLPAISEQVRESLNPTHNSTMEAVSENA
jgi:lipopolysaccharide/colanic/teichoic acid biosynthesis glycosyltransferase